MLKIKTWLTDNWKGFLISILVLISLDVIPILALPKWALLVITILIYFSILLYKVYKNKPF